MGENIYASETVCSKFRLIRFIDGVSSQDNASNNKRAMKLGSKFVAVWFAKNTLQLAITDIFKSKAGNIEINDYFEKKYGRISEFSNNELQEASKMTNITAILAVLANATRWNSTEASLLSLL